MSDEHVRLNSATNRRLHCRACDAETLHVVHSYECTECGTPRLWHAKVKALPAAGPWVSVEERLPEPGLPVLVSMRADGETDTCVTEYDDGWWFERDGVYKVTRWAPINPPREETNR